MDENKPVLQMEISPLAANAATLQKELEWFARVVDTRILTLFRFGMCVYVHLRSALARFGSGRLHVRGFLQYYRMNLHERLILVLALCPHIKPELLDIFLIENERTKRGYTEFGGIRGNLHGGFIPTVETAAFLISGKNMAERFFGIPLF